MDLIYTFHIDGMAHEVYDALLCELLAPPSVTLLRLTVRRTSADEFHVEALARSPDSFDDDRDRRS